MVLTRMASRLRADRTVYVEKLRAHAADWSKLVIARALLERARQRYEKERQPAVIRRAGSFFSTLTGGRYTRLHVPLGEQEPVVFDGSGRQKKVVQLSRGTRDQLYLALRLGLIQEFGEQVGAPPGDRRRSPRELRPRPGTQSGRRLC